MRALLVGLIGAGLALSSAGASECVVLERPAQPYVAAGPMQHPELVGQRFQVSRTTYQRKRERVEARETDMLLGYEAYQIKGSAGTFTVQRMHVPGSPAVQAVSFEGSPSSVSWAKPSRKVAVGDHVLDGPLSDLVVTPAKCPD